MLHADDTAPTFELTDLDGQRHTLGTLSLAIFFKTTCGTCTYAWPYFERLYQAYRGAGLNVLGVSQHDAERTRAFGAEFGSTFPLLLDEGFVYSRQYDPEFVPTGFLIDAHKKIVFAFGGWNREQYEALGQEIAQRLGVPPRQLISPGEEVVLFKPG